MFDSNQFFSGGAAGFYPKTIEQSLRFNDDDSAYLSKTFGTPTSADIFTFSCWVKRCSFAGTDWIFNPTNGAGEGLYFSSGNINVARNGAILLASTAVFRDPSAWYHIVAVSDMANATPSLRFRVYVNGEEIAWTTDARSSYTSFASWNRNTVSHQIAYNAASPAYSDFYLADVHFIDGQALDADDFGELKNGVWVAKDYAGTYGTNGFYLDFSTSGDGTTEDISGNGNNWTENNITASDVVLDSPTDNFATLNPLYTASSTATFSDGNLKVVTPASGYGTSVATIVPSSGQYYAEFTASDALGMIGIRDISLAATTATTVSDGATNCIGWYSGNGNFYYNGTSVLTSGNTYGSGDVIGVAIDYDADSVSWYKNGVLEHTQSSLDLTNVTFAIGDFGNSTSATITANFGQLGFTYTPPTDYLALSTANLPNPAIDPAQGSSPEDYFGTVLYTAASSDGTYTHGDLSFRPDFTWIKNRNNVERHFLIDVLRGNTSVTDKFLVSNDTAAEGANGVVGTTFSVTESGYEFVESSINTGELYFNSRTYVGWNWKANGSGVSNTEGTITSTVSANTESGFSIVSYTGSTNESVGHGLDQAPECILVKDEDASSSWAVYHQGVQDSTANGFLELNTTSAVQTGSNPRFLSGTAGTSQPTSTVFYVNNYSGSTTNNTGNDYIAYCFHSVEGFSKFGSYTGNGSTDGTFVYTGFRPAFVMIKRTDTTANWSIIDTARDTSNVMGSELFANLSNAEQSNSSDIDFVSNGFKFRRNYTDNNSGGTYIYMAFADDGGAFKYSVAR